MNSEVSSRLKGLGSEGCSVATTNLLFLSLEGGVHKSHDLVILEIAESKIFGFLLILGRK